MKELFLAYLFKLRHDITFKVTLIIGGGLALVMTLIYFGLSYLLETNMINGTQMMIASLSPVQNFGLAVPINLITFTVMEFNQGGIRNKIIGGHSKGQIYTSIFLNGLVFTFFLMIIYVLLSFGLGNLFGWFFNMSHEGAEVIQTSYADYYILKMIILAALCYVSIVSFTIFFATLFRNIGPAIPVIIIGLLACYLAGTIISMVGAENQTALWVGRIIDPLYCIGASETVDGGTAVVIDGITLASSAVTVTTETFVSGIISNLAYTALFFTGGILIFSKRDIK